jgi:hypothetical protein
VGGGLDPSTGLGSLCLDSGLLGLEHVFINAIAVEELQELLLLALEVSQSSLVAFRLLARRLQPDADLLLEFAPDLLALGRRELDRAVVALDG